MWRIKILKKRVKENRFYSNWPNEYLVVDEWQEVSSYYESFSKDKYPNKCYDYALAKIHLIINLILIYWYC